MFDFPFFSSTKGQAARPLLDDFRSLLVQQSSGKWSHAARAGRVFYGNIAATGLVLPIFSNTAQKMGLWNPAGSGVNGVLIKARASYVDTTGATGGYCLGITKNAGAAEATGGISVFTDDIVLRGLPGMQTGGNKIRFTGTAATVIAPTLLCQLGINQTVLTATDATNGFFAFKEDWDGELQIPPNTAVWFCGNIATLAKIAATVAWAEEPV